MLQRNSKETVRTLFTIIYTWCSIYKLLQEEVQKFFQLQQLAAELQITGLSRSKLIFQDFPGPGNFTNTILWLSTSSGIFMFATYSWYYKFVIHARRYWLATTINSYVKYCLYIDTASSQSQKCSDRKRKVDLKNMILRLKSISIILA